MGLQAGMMEAMAGKLDPERLLGVKLQVSKGPFGDGGSVDIFYRAKDAEELYRVVNLLLRPVPHVDLADIVVPEHWGIKRAGDGFAGGPGDGICGVGAGGGGGQAIEVGEITQGGG